jgi:hypothetical protein
VRGPTRAAARTPFIQDALLATYSGGLGVTNRDISAGDWNEDQSPEHAMDNIDRYDSVQFAFSQAIKLTGLEVGWIGDDSDITVLAYTGAGSPALGGSTYGSLLSSGWTFIGHYAQCRHRLGKQSTLAV